MPGGNPHKFCAKSSHVEIIPKPQGPSVLDYKLDFISAMLAMQGTRRAVAQHPRASSPNPKNGAWGVLLECASVAQLLIAIEI